jgi:hypothetical protein
MSKEFIHFSIRSKLKVLFDRENIKLPHGFLSNLLRVLSNFTIYEEEEERIRPRLIIGKELGLIFQDSCIKSFTFTTGMFSGKDLKNKLKPLIPFCNNSLIIYCDIQSNSKVVEFGIFRAFSGPSGLPYEEIVDGKAQAISCVEVQVMDDLTFVVKGYSSARETVVSHCFCKEEFHSPDSHWDCLTEDIFRECNGRDPTEMSRIKMTFKKSFSQISRQLHGTILAVVPPQQINKVRKNILKDGMWLPNPIGIYDKVCDILDSEKLKSQNYTLVDEFYGYSGMLLRMLNTDGITVVSSSGKILAFNCFIRPNDTQSKGDVIGGARRRATEALLTYCDCITGVYFQSQDGHAFYRRTK